MGYSREIDGLRAISVILVILFHVEKNLMPGGYIGVDTFFVISGFLITSQVYKEVAERRFSFAAFYKRRFARLLPALILMLLITAVFGFLFYSKSEFDSLGKDIFFSAIGLKNILDAQGVNYFAQDETVKPLLHMWSLGVEEQYYLVWPITLMVIYFLARARTLYWVLGLTVLLTVLSEVGARTVPLQAYFMPQFRAFELMIGSGAAILIQSRNVDPQVAVPLWLRSVLTSVSIVVILVCALAFSDTTVFPGINGAIVCLASLCLITLPAGTPVGWVLSRKPVVFIGLVSYPLYLFHQPIISFTTFFYPEINIWILLALVLVLGIGISALVYRYCETPVRKIAKQGRGTPVQLGLVGVTLAIAAFGFWIATASNADWRLERFNRYALDLSRKTESTFGQNYRKGVYFGGEGGKRILFIGDSLAQQYVLPLSQAWGYSPDQVDVVSRGGCVLLKDVDYRDSFSLMSCDDLRDKLYHLDRKYDRVVFSQGWHLYGGDILNADAPADNGAYSPEQWKPFIDATADYFSDYADDVYVIGPHVILPEDFVVRLSPMTGSGSIRKLIDEGRTDPADLQERSKRFGQVLGGREDLKILYPGDIWCDGAETCTLDDGELPYFKDHHHFGANATAFLTGEIPRSSWN
ncbi:acyltransferase family protein [Chachezhania sediminis]|uniref:acyltransferase family protein n=1 Tax=Chachezhania sediminis TaxID=2599291 RepID=UPI00131CA654|nr:acyltransferase family protein [Chachezhania sediminis]